MKKGLLMLGAAALALASCTNEEVLNVSDSRAIGFDAFVGKTTKAEITKDNLTTFQVYGGYVKTEDPQTETNLNNVWEDTEVTKDNGWKATGEPKYWNAGMTYQFAAYAPDAVGKPAINADNKNLDWTDIVADASTQNDFIYATKTVTTADPLTASPGKVKFEFGHQLAMIKVTFNSKFTSEYKVTISDLKIYGMNSKANFTGTTKTWSSHSDQIAQAAGFTTISSADAQGITPATSNKFIVIPQTTGIMNVDFTATVFDKNNTEFAKHKFTGTASINWTNGNVYNYNVDITPDGFHGGGEGESDIFEIEFDAPDVTPWIPNQQDGNVDL